MSERWDNIAATPVAPPPRPWPSTGTAPPGRRCPPPARAAPRATASWLRWRRPPPATPWRWATTPPELEAFRTGLLPSAGTAPGGRRCPAPTHPPATTSWVGWRRPPLPASGRWADTPTTARPSRLWSSTAADRALQPPAGSVKLFLRSRPAPEVGRDSSAGLSRSEQENVLRRRGQFCPH